MTDTKREPVAAQVPLAEQLARVPADARLIYEHSPTEHSFIPVGPMCHEAAATIARLREALREAREVFANCPARADRLARIDALLDGGSHGQ
jgi:hypothetical protein